MSHFYTNSVNQVLEFDGALFLVMQFVNMFNVCREAKAAIVTRPLNLIGLFSNWLTRQVCTIMTVIIVLTVIIYLHLFY